MESLNVVFTGQNQVEVVREAVPAPAPNEILLRAERSLISTGTECIVLARNFAPNTHWDNWVKYPFSPGYSMVARASEVGADVDGVQVGERVAVRVSHRSARTLALRRESDGVLFAGGGEVLPVPDGVSNEDATFFALSNIVQNGVRRAEHELGDAVVIIGLGLLGQLATRYVRAFGAREVIAIDTAPARLELAKLGGATQTLQMNVAEAKDAVWELTGGRGADVVYDITGHPSVFAPALSLARDFGTLLLLGDAGDPSKQTLTSDVIGRGVRIVGAHDNHPPHVATKRDRWNKARMTELFFSFLSRGQISVSELITHRFAPQDAPDAYNLLLHQRDAAMGVVFDWSQL